MPPNNFNTPNVNSSQPTSQTPPVQTPPQNTPDMSKMTQGAPINTESHHSNKMKPILTIIILFIILVLAGLGYSKLRTTAPESNLSKATEVDSAPGGSLVAGFTQSFIIVSDAIIVNSKRYLTTDKNGNVDLFTTHYTTQSSSNSIYTAYLDYLRKNGYEVKKSEMVNDSMGKILAQRTINSSTNTVVVSVSDMTDTRNVSIILNRPVK